MGVSKLTMISLTNFNVVVESNYKFLSIKYPWNGRTSKYICHVLMLYSVTLTQYSDLINK